MVGTARRARLCPPYEDALRKTWVNREQTVKRREFMAAVGGAALLPLTARAARSASLRTIAILMTPGESSQEGRLRLKAFQDRLAELGWREADNIRFEIRWSESNSELTRKYAAELASLAPDAIVANGTPSVVELKKLTGSIPVVCAMVQDPVRLGLVQSLARPGGNITGFTFVNPELIGKWIGLLKEVQPSLSRAAVMFNPRNTPFLYDFIRDIKEARQTSNVELAAMAVTTPEDIDRAITGLSRQPDSGLILPPDPFNVDHVAQLATSSTKNRLPAVSVYRPFAAGGGLMAYGPDTAEIFRQAAGYIDLILKGALPAELPVQQPTKYQFTVNLKTAGALGLAMPPTLLATADEVIE
jgi:putative tryptophan/tyrosine transport system substrate-binding protein